MIINKIFQSKCLQNLSSKLNDKLNLELRNSYQKVYSITNIFSNYSTDRKLLWLLLYELKLRDVMANAGKFD